MARRMLSNRQWKRLKPLLPSERGYNGRPYAQSHRTTMEGILWIARTGAPWRDLPAQVGKWGAVYQRFNRWVKEGVFDQMVDSLARAWKLDVVMVDGTFSKVHQHGTGAPQEDAHLTNPGPNKPLDVARVG